MQRCSGSAEQSHSDCHLLIESSFSEDLDNPAFGTLEKLQHSESSANMMQMGTMLAITQTATCDIVL